MQYGGAIRKYSDVERLAEKVNRLNGKVTGIQGRLENMAGLSDQQLRDMKTKLRRYLEKNTTRLNEINAALADRGLIRLLTQESKERRIANPATLLNSLAQQCNRTFDLTGELINTIDAELIGREAERVRLEAEQRRERARLEQQERDIAEIRRLTDAQIRARIAQFAVMQPGPVLNALEARLNPEQLAALEAARQAAQQRRAFAARPWNNDGWNDMPGIMQPLAVAGTPTDHLPIPTDLWAGFTRADVQDLNSVFDTKGMLEDYETYPGTKTRILNEKGKPKPIYGKPVRESNAACPICLAFLPRGQGCFYLQGHDCRKLAKANGSGLYHHELYDKYKNDDGTVVVCSICSRICQNRPESHLKLVAHDAPRAPVTGRFGDPFGSEASCIASGGGGFAEKIMRFNALRNKAFELNKQIGKMTKYEAFKQIVEAAWDAPLNPPAKINTGKFTVLNKDFPTAFKTKHIKKIIPHNGFSEPDIITDDTNSEIKILNSYIFSEGAPLIQFHHHNSAGVMNDHEGFLVGPEGLVQHLWSDPNDPTMKFRCPQSTCKGYLYPEEVESALLRTDGAGRPYFTLSEKDLKHIKQYRQKFYSEFKLDNNTSANNDEADDMFHSMEDASCTTGGGAGGPSRLSMKFNKSWNEGEDEGGGGAGGKGGYRKRSRRRSRKARARKTRKN